MYNLVFYPTSELVFVTDINKKIVENKILQPSGNYKINTIESASKAPKWKQTLIADLCLLTL